MPPDTHMRCMNMTVAELRKFLENLPNDMRIYLQEDISSDHHLLAVAEVELFEKNETFCAVVLTGHA